MVEAQLDQMRVGVQMLVQSGADRSPDVVHNPSLDPEHVVELALGVAP
jgi:hypothetical protein